jgi:hypothetical protein
MSAMCNHHQRTSVRQCSKWAVRECGDYESGVAGAARRREKAPQEEAGRDGKLIRGEGMRVPPFAANAFRAGWFTGREARAPLRLTGQDGRVVCQGSRPDWQR